MSYIPTQPLQFWMARIRRESCCCDSQWQAVDELESQNLKKWYQKAPLTIWSTRMWLFFFFLNRTMLEVLPWDLRKTNAVIFSAWGVLPLLLIARRATGCRGNNLPEIHVPLHDWESARRLTAVTLMRGVVPTLLQICQGLTIRESPSLVHVLVTFFISISSEADTCTWVWSVDF